MPTPTDDLGVTADRPRLELRGLRRHYRSTRFTLGPLDVAIRPGVTCVVGANGAGKSTMFRVLAGLESPDGGTIELGRTSGAQVGLMPQDPELPRRATAVDYLQHIGWLYRIPARERARRVDDVLAAVSLSERGSDRIGVLSGGMARRLALAAALLPRPALLLLDEPTAGLDPLQRISMRETIAGLPDEVTVLVSTHLVEDVRGLDGSVLVLNRGTLVFDGSVPDLESTAPGTGPGDTPLERAVAALMAEPPGGPRA